MSPTRSHCAKPLVVCCPHPGSNRGPLDLQSNALPTELSRPDGVQSSLEKLALKLTFSPNEKQKLEVPPRFELGSPDSESGVLTITPWDLTYVPTVIH